MVNAVNVQYREVKRKAAVGERIKIVAADVGGYVNGDELIVVDASWPHIGSVDATLNGVREHVWFREYVVLEPVTEPAAPSPLSSDPLYAAFRQFVADNADEIRAILPELEAEVNSTLPPLQMIMPGDGHLVITPERGLTFVPALTRAQVIAKATADVAELTYKMCGYDAQGEGNYTFRQCVSTPEFHVNRTKRVVTVLVRGTGSGEIREKGIAKAAPDDVFHAEIGKAIALRRALGLTVPDKYMNAPKPDKACAGAKVGVKSARDDEHQSVFIVSKEVVDYCDHLCEEYVNITLPAMGRSAAIIDDTDVDYNVVSTKGAAA